MEPTIYKPSIYKGAGIYKIGAEGGGGGGDVPSEDYNILSGITNGTSNFCGISSNQISIDVLTSDLIEFNLFISGNWASLNPDLYLIDDYSNGRALGFFLDYQYCYLTNRPIYENYQGGILPQINKNTSLKISQKGGSIFVNGEEFVISSNTGEQMQHLTRFFVSPGNYPQQIVINSMIVKDKDGNYKYNFIPVLNKQTNQKGLFETVGQTFHYLSNYQV